MAREYKLSIMNVRVNSRTGLKESDHDIFDVPVVHQKSIGSLKFNGQTTAVHTVPAGHGLTLDWYSRLRRSNELLVTFQGANRPSKNIYPLFPRVNSMRDKGPAHIAFADPSLMLDKSRQLLLSWHLGGEGWDPLPLVLRVIRKAAGKTGAKHIAFIGGSGGGFAALRASAMTPGSLAFVQEPQTDLRNYNPKSVEKYFQAGWPGWDHLQLMDALPERFDMVRHYRQARPTNFVYYTQSEDDTAHVSRHFAPFGAIHGLGAQGGINAANDRNLVLYKGRVAGHGKITADEYDTHFDNAINWWRGLRV